MTDQLWHNFEWFMQYFANPLAAVVLVAVTWWYASSTRRIPNANQAMTAATKEMVEATRSMAEIAEKTYLASLLPDIDVRTPEAVSLGATSYVKATIQNRGQVRVKLVCVKAETGGPGHEYTHSLEYNKWLAPHEDLAIVLEAPAPGIRDGRIELEDIAGQKHTIALRRLAS